MALRAVFGPAGALADIREHRGSSFQRLEEDRRFLGAGHDQRLSLGSSLPEGIHLGAAEMTVYGGFRVQFQSGLYGLAVQFHAVEAIAQKRCLVRFRHLGPESVRDSPCFWGTAVYDNIGYLNSETGK